jgi:hypothetical protein
MPELKLYTVADLREWLTNNHPAEGLSEQVIAPTRAWAIIHNPYVKEEDAIVAAILEDGELAAYTASFPDILDGKRVWWASTLYCYPQFTGKGYGLIVVGSLMEAHEPELTYDRWAAKETVEIFNHFGYQTTYTKRYHLSDKKIDTTSLKGKLAYCVQALKKWLHPWPKASKANYTVQYVERIDDEAYAFMKAHRNNDLWLREQEMLNWLFQYPFFNSRKPIDDSREKCFFGDEAEKYEYKEAKVYVEGQLQGLYVLRQHDEELSVVYFYYTFENRDVVFDSIIDYIIANKPKSFVTENQYLYERVRECLYFPKNVVENVSLSLPDNKQYLANFTLQLGDGDSFA